MRHPMHCYNFLKSLNRHLSRDRDPGPLSPTDKAAEKKGKKVSKKPAHSPIVRGVRSDALQLLTTLALTHAHLSRNTVLLLEVLYVHFHPLCSSIDIAYDSLSRFFAFYDPLLSCRTAGHPRAVHGIADGPGPEFRLLLQDRGRGEGYARESTSE